MRKRTLGRTKLEVSELALGGLFVSKHGGEFEQSRAAIIRALKLGVNYIDTAPSYANSEEVLGQVLSEINAPVIISTKLGGRPQPFDPQNRDALLRSVEESLRLLKRDCIDILMIHEPDRQGQYPWWTDLERFQGPVLEVLDELRRQGVIRYTGVGGTTAYELARVMETERFDVVLTAFNYNVLWREAEHEILPTARRLNMGIIIGSPLQQGVLAKRHDAEINDPRRCRWLSAPRRRQLQALYRYLDEIGMELPEVALRFVISNPDISCVLMGARSAEEVERNVAAINAGPLPAKILANLQAIADTVPFRPYEEPWRLPFDRDAIQALGRVR